MTLVWIALFVVGVTVTITMLALRARRRTRLRLGRQPARKSPVRPMAQRAGGGTSQRAAKSIGMQSVVQSPAPSGSLPGAPAADPVAPPRPTLTLLHAPVTPASFTELAGLEPAPDGTDRPWDQPVDPAVLFRILGQASEVLDRVAARRVVLEAVSKPSPDPRVLTDVVVSDPALSARVLGMVNSPFFALRHPMASVFRAVLYLGHQEVRSIVWRASFADAAGDLPGVAGEMLDETWRHSFAVSRVAYALGRALGVPQPDAVATAALLHDAGKMLVIATVPEKAATVYRPSCFGSAAQLRREWETIGIGHGLLGGEVVRAWGLPAEVAFAVQQHHLPSFLSPDHVRGDSSLIGVVHLADLICHAFSRADAGEVLHLPADGWLSELRVTGDLSSICDHTVLRALRGGPGAMAGGDERAA